MLGASGLPAKTLLLSKVKITRLLSGICVVVQKPMPKQEAGMLLHPFLRYVKEGT